MNEETGEVVAAINWTRCGVTRTDRCHDSILWSMQSHQWDLLETVTADKRQAVERTESGMVAEFLEVPQNSLQTCTFRAEWNLALSRMERAQHSK